MATTDTPTPPLPDIPGPAKPSLREQFNDLASGKWRSNKEDTGSLVDDGLPQINLVSSNILEARAAKKLSRQLIAAGLVVLLIIAGVYIYKGRDFNDANSQLSRVQGQIGEITSAKAALDKLNNFANTTEATSQQIQGELAAAVNTAAVVNEFTSSMPSGVTLDSYSLTLSSLDQLNAGLTTGPPSVLTQPCGSSPNPFSTTAKIGCIRFAGTAKTYLLAANLANHLYGKYLTGPVITPITPGPGGFTFSGTVEIKPDAMSNNYVAPGNKTSLKQQLQTYDSANAAAATPSPTASAGS